MIIHRSDEVRRELLAMTREIAAQEELNYQITECIQKRLIVPPDQPELRRAAEGVSSILGIPAGKAMPLIVLARRIGMEDGRLPGFLRKMERCLTIYRAQDLKANPYFHRIKAPGALEGSFRFQSTEFLSGEMFLDREPVSEGYARVNTLGIFDGTLHYPGFYEGDRCWMSITPNEIVTMQDPIDRACGKVLTLGLGLGYYAYMTHIKENVESVTIIEREPAVISLFEKTLLPQFDFPDKIRIIRADAFDYMETLADGEFDYCFADIWQNPLDGMNDYLHVRQLGNRFRRMACDYWIEESFIGFLEQSMANVLQFEFLGEDDAQLLSRPGYRVVKRLLSDTKISSAEDIRRLFGGPFLRRLLDTL